MSNVRRDPHRSDARRPRPPTCRTSASSRDQGVGGAAKAFVRRVRSGDLGSLPVVVGLIVIWAVFQILNHAFLSPGNLVNLTLQCAAIGTIAIGIVLVLLLGEIDLSVGCVSGLAAAILGQGLTTLGWPLWLAILVALAVGAVIGLLYGLLFTRFGVPSFVITLAGLLGFLGLQLMILGPNGSINLPFDSPIVQFAQRRTCRRGSPTCSSSLAAGGCSSPRSVAPPAAAGRPVDRRVSLTIVKAVALLLGLGVIVWYLSRDFGTAPRSCSSSRWSS